jgi:hypothetical protein
VDNEERKSIVNSDIERSHQAIEVVELLAEELSLVAGASIRACGTIQVDK